MLLSSFYDHASGLASRGTFLRTILNALRRRYSVRRVTPSFRDTSAMFQSFSSRRRVRFARLMSARFCERAATFGSSGMSCLSFCVDSFAPTRSSTTLLMAGLGGVEIIQISARARVIFASIRLVILCGSSSD